jgi:general secretion pathway protein A
MYASYFGLAEPPFSISPDPRFLYMSRRHREAMAHLLYGIREGGGFVQLTGEVGTGKTTLCRCLIEQVPANVDVALILQPQIKPSELLAMLCDELKIRYPDKATPKTLLDRLNAHLLHAYAKGRRTVLIIDEAQLLTRVVLEQIRILTNLETAKGKLLRIILVGQPELNVILGRANMRQLAQRITARYHLMPLSRRDTEEYVRYRLSVARCQRPLFTAWALRRVYGYSGGVPRLVNVICDRALLGAYAWNKNKVGGGVVRRAAAEVLGGGGRPLHRRWLWTLPALVAATALALSAQHAPLREMLPGKLHWWRAPVTAVAVPSVGPAGRDERPTAGARPGPSPAGARSASSSPAHPDLYAPELAVAVPGRHPAPALTPVSAPTTQAPVDTGALQRILVQAGDATSSGPAFTRLLRSWGVGGVAAASGADCAAARVHGLECLRSRGNWNSLRSMNRAAILLLRGGQRHHHVVVTALDHEHAMVDLGDAKYRIPLSEFDADWYGEYLLLWRPPPLRSYTIGEDARGADVLWLRQALNRLGGGQFQQVPVDNAEFDNELRARVIGFQRGQALAADGVVGVEMLIRLNTMLDAADVPLLRRMPAS